jgi:phage terminase small subunit
MPVLTNIRHELFAQAIARGENASQAYKQTGMKYNTGNAAKLNANKSVKARVEEILSQAVAANGVTVEKIVAELANIAFSNMADYVEWGTAKLPPKAGPKAKLRDPAFVRLKDWDTITPAKQRVIAEVKRTMHGAAIKTYDKLAAIRILAQHLGMLAQDKDDKSGTDELVKLIVAAHRKSQGDDAVVIEGTNE